MWVTTWALAQCLPLWKLGTVNTSNAIDAFRSLVPAERDATGLEDIGRYNRIWRGRIIASASNSRLKWAVKWPLNY